jgi:hypothetical protein
VHNDRRKPVALFLTYQRTTFVDAFRTARQLKVNGTYEPMFLMADGTAKLLEQELALCRNHGIGCATEEDVLASGRFFPAEAERHIREANVENKAAPAGRVVPTQADKAAPAGCVALAQADKIALPVRQDRPYWKQVLRPVVVVVLKKFPKLIYGVRATTNFLRSVPRYILSGRIWRVPSPASVMVQYCANTTTPASSDLTIRLCRVVLRMHNAFEARPRKLTLRRRLQRIRRFSWYLPFRDIIRVELRYKRILRLIAPDIVCLSEDIPGPLTAPFIRAARSQRIPSVTIPFTIPNPIEPAQHLYRRADAQVRTVLDHVVVAAFPRWSMRYKGRLLLRLPHHLVVASEFAGISPPNPWVVNSGHADRIAVESRRMLEVYQALGFPPDQLALTGTGGDDLLAAALQERQARRNAVYKQLDLPADRPMLLSALVPDQLAAGVSECEFTRYADLVEFWVKTIAAARPKFNVVLKINPRERREDYLHLEKLGVVVAPHDTIELVPLADVYVASISATLRWAAACGIPSVNYDVYHFRYGDYAGAPGIVHVEKKNDFSAVIARLAGDEAYLKELRCRQLADAAHWGRLDGRSTQRLIDLFDELRAEARYRAQQ